MSETDIGDWRYRNVTNRRIVRSALILAGSTLMIAAPLCLFSILTKQSGSSGPWGVAGAASACLFAGLAADVIAAMAHRAASPLVGVLAGMAMRLLPPLIICLILALEGGGREHLAFVVYLLTFYLVTLTLDTWWAVQRVGCAASHVSRRSS